MSKDTKQAGQAGAQATPDTGTTARVIESIVLRGDLSGLAPRDRARFYVTMCERLGLNPNAQPFAFLRLNGKEVLYATRGCTDQLAAIHRINREIVDGPKVIDLAGMKLVYAVCRASHPNGRVETSTATVPLADPINVLMKAETKAKRRATLSILGLAMLDEMELETIPAGAQEPGGGVDFSHLAGDPDPAAAQGDERAAEGADVPAQLGDFYARIAEIELPGEAVSVWMKHRGDLAPLPANDREAAWKALCRKTEEVGKMKNAKVWLKKAISEEDARRAGGADPQAALSESGDPRAATPRSGSGDDGDDTPDGGGAAGGGGAGAGAKAAGGGAVARASSGPRAALDALVAHLAAKPHVRDPHDKKGRDAEYAAVATSYLKRAEELAAEGLGDDALDAVRAELRGRGCTDPDAFLEGVRNNLAEKGSELAPPRRRRPPVSWPQYRRELGLRQEAAA